MIHVLILISMGEFVTKVTLARPGTRSLRTTIPEGIARLIDLEQGDVLVWSLKANKDGVIITLSKGK